MGHCPSAEVGTWSAERNSKNLAPRSSFRVPRWALLVAALGVGCSATNHQQATGDPILGGGVAVAPPGRTVAPAAAPKVAATNTPLPPLPAPSSSTSPAALAAGPVPALDPSNDLRIGPSPGGPVATLTSNPKPPQRANDWQAQGNTPGAAQETVPSTTPIAVPAPPPSGQTAILHPPGPPAPTDAHPVALAAGNAPPPPAPRVQSLEQAQAALHGRNVVWQDLKSWSDNGEWRFSCSVPNKQNPSLNRTYEARASSPLAAIQAALDKMDADAVAGN
jgi:hypothetical protein